MLTRITVTTVVCALLFIAQSASAQLADFTATTSTEGCFPLTVDFKDTSSGSPNSWLWDFGNNKTSTLQNPSTVYTEPGVYDVSLTVSNGGSPSTRIRAGFVVVHDYPAVDFSFDITSGCSPLTVKFKDQTSTKSGAIANWFWVFGDGGTSSSANPNYTFATPGSYTVSLRVRNEFGCEKIFNHPTQIKVLGPIAKFVSDKTAVCTTPASFQFTNQTAGNNTYEWNFGDGTTSTTASPSHTYQNAGTYTVTLKAKDANGCEYSTKSNVSAGTEGGLTLLAEKDKVCLNEEIQFDLQSTNAPVSVNWNFGDGTTSQLNDPKKTYSQPGTYTVTLNALLLNHSCNSIVQKTILVARPTVPSFTYTTDCNYKLTLTSTSTNATRIEWYIENQNVITGNSTISPLALPGSQNIRIVAYDAAGCSNEKEQTAFVPPNPSAAFRPENFQSCNPNEKILAGCAPFTVNFEDATISNQPYTVQWEFGDGQTSTQSNPNHLFNKGQFQITLTATDGRGCKGVSTKFVQVADAAPKADFTIDKTSACPGELVTFTNKSTGGDYWCWDFGDGGTDSGESPTYKYDKPGTYTVKLIAKNAGCTHLKEMINVITIRNPYINFKLTKNCVDPHSVALENISQNYVDLKWNFGDGQTSTDPNLQSHRFTDEGLYKIVLSGKNIAAQCEVFREMNVIIQDVKADFELNTDKPCIGAPLVFTDKSKAAVLWDWKIAGQEYSIANVSTKIKTAGNYTAALKVTDTDGCTNTKTVPITVLDIQGNFNFDAASTCDQLDVNFTSISTGSPAPTGWDWNFGDGATATTENASHSYTQLGEYNVSLTITNVQGSCTFTREKAVTFTIPEPSFTTAKTIFCPDDLVQVANTTKNAVIYEWDYGDGRRADFRSPSIRYSQTGKYTLTLFAKDGYGCERKVVKDEFVAIEKPTAGFSVKTAAAPCPPFTAEFVDNSFDDIKGWEWDFGDGKHSILKDPANIYQKPGKFDVKLTVTDINGCTDSKTFNQFVSVGGPTGNFTNNGAALCTNQEIVFNANVVNTATLRWDFGDGVVVEGSSSSTQMSHQYTTTGTFTPALILIDGNGCQTIADGADLLQIQDTTAVSMSVGLSCIRSGEAFTVTGKSDNIDDIIGWSWTVDGVDQGTGDNFKTSLDQPGMHFVVGRATNKFNCISNAIDTVRIQGDVVNIPNVITPNGDAANQTFKFPGLEYATWHMEILNRWGNSVYQKVDYRGDWDGEQQPAGVYYFILRNTHCEDKDYRGFVSIVR